MNSLASFFIRYLLLSIVAITILSIIEEVYYFKAFGIEIINLVGIERLIFSARGISNLENISAIVICPTFICLVLIFQEWLKDSLSPGLYRRWIFFIIALPIIATITILPFSWRTTALSILIANSLLLLIAYLIIFHLRLCIAQTLAIQVFLISFILLSMLARFRIDIIINNLRNQKPSIQAIEQVNTNKERKLIYIGRKGEYDLYFDPNVKTGIIKKKDRFYNSQLLHALLL